MSSIQARRKQLARLSDRSRARQLTTPWAGHKLISGRVAFSVLRRLVKRGARRSQDKSASRRFHLFVLVDDMSHAVITSQILGEHEVPQNQAELDLLVKDALSRNKHAPVGKIRIVHKEILNDAERIEET